MSEGEIVSEDKNIDDNGSEDHVLICARALYEQTDVPMARIAKLMGIGQSTLSRRVVRMGWNLRLPSRLGKRKEPEGATMKGLSRRVRAHIERQILLAEFDLSKPGPRTARANDSERAARTLASLVKTMAELKRIEGETPHEPVAERDEIDVDEFRRDLARRLEALLDSAADEAGRLSDSAGEA